VTKPLNASPPLIAKQVYEMYCQLVEIHAIAATQLAECSYWLRSNLTSHPFQVKTGWPKPVMTPSMIRSAPSPPTDFSSQARHGDRIDAKSLTLAAKITKPVRARYPRAAHRAHGKADIATPSGARSRNCETSPTSTAPVMR
jgi:hypothetical protein